MQAPTQITPSGLADYLDVITRAVFQSGMSWRVVEAKWAGFREAFAGFDPAAVAAFTDDDVERLAGDQRIIRNRRKIEATITNAQAMIAIEDGEPDGFIGWLRSRGDFDGDGRRPARRVPVPRRHGRLLRPVRRGRGCPGARGLDEDPPAVPAAMTQGGPL